MRQESITAVALQVLVGFCIDGRHLLTMLSELTDAYRTFDDLANHGDELWEDEP